MSSEEEGAGLGLQEQLALLKKRKKKQQKKKKHTTAADNSEAGTEAGAGVEERGAGELCSGGKTRKSSSKKKKEKKEKKEKEKSAKLSMLSFGDEAAEDEALLHEIKSKVRGKGERRHAHSGADPALALMQQQQQQEQQQHGAGAGGGAGGERWYTKEMMAELRSNAIHFRREHPLESVRNATLDPETMDDLDLREAHGQGQDQDQDVLSAAIPSQKEIEAARRHRQKIRDQGGSSVGQFIPLSGRGPAPGMGGEGRGQDDYDEDGDDEVMRDVAMDDGAMAPEIEVFDDHMGNRIAFGDPGRDRGPDMLPMRSLASSGPRQGNAVDDGDDDVMRDWEMELIRRAGGAGTESTVSSGSGSARDGHTQKKQSGRDAAVEYPDSVPSQPWPHLDLESFETVSVDALCEQMQVVLQDLKFDKASKEGELERVKERLKALDQKMVDLDRDVQACNDQFQFFQRARDDVLDELDFLAEKAPLIEDVTDKLVAWTEKRCKKRLEFEQALMREEERQQGIVDEKRDPHASSSSAASAAQVDEFGRSIRMAHKNARLRVASKLRNRRAIRDTARLAAASSDPSGWSSGSDVSDGEGGVDLDLGGDDDGGHGVDFDSDSDSDADAEADADEDADDDGDRDGGDRGAGNAILQELESLFDDARDEFRTFDHTTDLLQEWKNKFPDLYAEAFVAISVPTIVAPYVRMDLARWNIRESQAFDSMPWYNKLLTYGVNDTTPASDPDLNLIPKLVLKLVVPHVACFLENEWRPLSSRDLGVAVSLIREVYIHIEGQQGAAGAVESIHDALVRVYQRASNACSTPLDALSGGLGSEAHTTAGQWALCRRRAWRGIKLAHLMQMWPAELVPAGKLLPLASGHMQHCVSPFVQLQLLKCFVPSSQPSYISMPELRKLVERLGALCRKAAVTSGGGGGGASGFRDVGATLQMFGAALRQRASTLHASDRQHVEAILDAIASALA